MRDFPQLETCRSTGLRRLAGPADPYAEDAQQFLLFGPGHLAEVGEARDTRPTHARRVRARRVVRCGRPRPAKIRRPHPPARWAHGRLAVCVPGLSDAVGAPPRDTDRACLRGGRPLPVMVANRPPRLCARLAIDGPTGVVEGQSGQVRRRRSPHLCRLARASGAVPVLRWPGCQPAKVWPGHPSTRARHRVHPFRPGRRRARLVAKCAARRRQHAAGRFSAGRTGTGRASCASPAAPR